MKQGIDFFDITDEPESDFHITEQAVAAFPNRLRYIQEAKPLAGKLSKDNMKKNLEKFSSFNNRYYRSQTGVDSANWMFEQVTALLKSSGAAQRGATVKKFTHSFLQPSIIATIPGKSANTIVVGAHQDSVNSRSPTNGRAPGADDNGSGSVTILEALGALLSSPNIAQGQADNTIEFHWYAGEEAGLLGSQDVFRKYKADNKPVKAMLNQDMTGYTRRRENDGLPEAMGLVTDNVNAELTTFTRLVIGGVSLFLCLYFSAVSCSLTLNSTLTSPSSTPLAATLAPITLPPPETVTHPLSFMKLTSTTTTQPSTLPMMWSPTLTSTTLSSMER